MEKPESLKITIKWKIPQIWKGVRIQKKRMEKLSGVNFIKKL